MERYPLYPYGKAICLFGSFICSCDPKFLRRLDALCLWSDRPTPLNVLQKTNTCSVLYIGYSGRGTCRRSVMTLSRYPFYQLHLTDRTGRHELAPCSATPTVPISNANKGSVKYCNLTRHKRAQAVHPKATPRKPFTNQPTTMIRKRKKKKTNKLARFGVSATSICLHA
jgi:hypothetical protein